MTPFLSADGRIRTCISQLRVGILPVKLHRQARTLYQSVCDDLWPVAEAFGEGKKPIPFGKPGSFHVEAADRLRSARNAEEKGLAVLEKIAAEL